MPYMTLCFRRLLSIAVIVGSANYFLINNSPIVAILSFISVEMVFFSRLSNVRLLEIDIRPQARANCGYTDNLYLKICAKRCLNQDETISVQ